jgi:hypothetical protein
MIILSHGGFWQQEFEITPLFMIDVKVFSLIV